MSARNFKTLIMDIDINIPEDCPDTNIFQETVRYVLHQRFSSTDTVKQCRDQWLATQIVPEPFASNPDAADHYRCAMLALSPEAQAWASFEDGVNREFAEYEDDGDRKEPAIPGWKPGWISLAG